MPSNVCQGLQSCIEPNVSRIRHENDNNNNHYSFHESKHQNHRDNDSFWSSITSQNSKLVNSESDKVYVHPLVKRSSSMLSTESLELCTESLGSETGSSVGESIDDSPSGPLPERYVSRGRRAGGESRKKIYRSASFPPPLTSISGSEGVQMRPHREGGRLVLKAYSVTSCRPYFKTERSNGRLRLSLLKEGEQEQENDFINNDVMHGLELQVEQLANADVEEESTDYEDYDDDDELELNGETIVGYDVGGMEEFPRSISSRCKEGGGNRNKGIPSWEPFWVAIS